MQNKLKNKKENYNRDKKSKEPNPVVMDGDSNMSKPVRGLK